MKPQRLLRLFSPYPSIGVCHEHFLHHRRRGRHSHCCGLPGPACLNKLPNDFDLILFACACSKAIAKQLDAQVGILSGPLGTSVPVTHATFGSEANPMLNQQSLVG
jgi:hypothetical protein